MNTKEKIEALTVLADSMCRNHCWLKTADGPRKLNKPFTAALLRDHAKGEKSYGLCPITPGENITRVALLDFDSHKGETSWEDMLALAKKIAFMLEQQDYEPLLFRSSGGRGIHIYLMWAKPQDAYSVREMLKATIATAGMKPGTGGVAKNQIEIYPKQNEVPTDGFGSMFILPWAGKSELLEC